MMRRSDRGQMPVCCSNDCLIDANRVRLHDLVGSCLGA